MSVQAMTKAFEQEIRPASTKFVFVTICNCANNGTREEGEDTWTAFPSIKRLCTDTGLDRKTVMDSIARLVESGYLSDTGERIGRTKRVKIYQIMFPKTASRGNSPEIGTSNSPENGTLNSPENGTLNQKDNRKCNRKYSANADGKPSSQEALFPETEPHPPADPPKERASELSPQERSNIWTLGKELLMNQDPKLTSNRAGGLLGKLAKINEKKLIEAIGYCTIHPKADVRSYLFAAVKGSGKISNIEQAKKAAIAENVQIKKGDTFEHLRDRIYQQREERLNGQGEQEQAESTA